MKKSSKFLTVALILVLALSIFTFVACNEPKAEEKVVRVSTTTSVNDSGLMEYLRPYFEADTGYKWEIASAGTGAAIQAAEYGNADVILVHSKKSEDEFIEKANNYARKVDGYEDERIPFMYNYFVLAGATADPAGVKSADIDSAAKAFKAIYDAGEGFVSRGDASGTHSKESSIWKDSGVPITSLTAKDKPFNAPATALGATTVPDWYKSIGQGMGPALLNANESSSYLISDKATFLAFQKNTEGNRIPNLSILREDFTDMKNTYTMIAVNKDAKFVSPDGKELAAGSVKINETAANVFINWMTSVHAKYLISQYGVTQYGEALFFLASAGDYTEL